MIVPSPEEEVNMKHRLAFFVCAAALAACGNSSTATTSSGPGASGAQNGSATSASGATSGAGGSTSSSSGAGGMSAVKFEDIVPIFEKSCGAKDDKCHSAAAYAAAKNDSCRGWLSLENKPLGSINPDNGKATGCPDMGLYDRLVKLDAWQCGPPGNANEKKARYVVPCDPAASYLYRKMIGMQICFNEAKNMPFDLMPPDKPPSTSDQMLVSAWIAAGAPSATNPGMNCNPMMTTSSSSTGAGPQDPVAQIFHPSDNEKRSASKPVPFIGKAIDPQEGELPGNKLTWTSSIDGVLGTGKMFDKTLKVGTHKITLEAIDSQNNKGSTSITLIMQ
jgi:hypothetical protein